MSNVKGKIALITGGASGIGRASASKLAKHGAVVIMTDVDEVPGAKVAREICAQGGKVEFLQQDVSSEQRWIEIATHIRDHHGRLDILVNNAGIGGGFMITDIPLEHWRNQQSINVEGTFLGIKHCLPLMRNGRGGSIINLSSIASDRVGPRMASYAASKAAVRAITKGVAIEAAADGVRCNSIHPGIIDTPIYGKVGHDAHVLGATTPLMRAGNPEEVADGVLYLASDQSSYVTGLALVIDGGRSLS